MTVKPPSEGSGVDVAVDVDVDVFEVVLSVVEVLEPVVVLERVDVVEVLDVLIELEELDVRVELAKVELIAPVPCAINAALDTVIVTPVPAQLFCIVAYTASKSPGLFCPTHCAVL